MSSKQEEGDQIFPNSPYLRLKVLYLKPSKIIAATRKVQNSNVIDHGTSTISTQFFQIFNKEIYFVTKAYVCFEKARK